MTVSLRPTARETLLGLPKPTRRRLQHAIDGLTADARPTAAIALAGQPDALRLRVGDHELIYTIHGKEVLILLIDHHNFI